MSFVLTWVVQTEGYSGAELAALCQEAAMLTMRENFQAEFVRGLRACGGAVPECVYRFIKLRSSLQRKWSKSKLPKRCCSGTSSSRGAMKHGSPGFLLLYNASRCILQMYLCCGCDLLFHIRVNLHHNLAAGSVRH